jgi:hypothetical protein
MVDWAGAAVSRVLDAVIDTTRKVFEPVALGLKAIISIEALGEG